MIIAYRRKEDGKEHIKGHTKSQSDKHVRKLHIHTKHTHTHTQTMYAFECVSPIEWKRWNEIEERWFERKHRGKTEIM